MKIVRRLNVNSCQTMKELDNGDVFRFLGEDTIYMMIEDNYCEKEVVDFESGETLSLSTMEAFKDKYVEVLKATLTVEN